jgi:hypothetical protein
VLVVNPEPLKLYVYGAIPPVTAPKVMEPLEVPQLADVDVISISVGPGTLLITPSVVKIQSFESFTDTG